MGSMLLAYQSPLFFFGFLPVCMLLYSLTKYKKLLLTLFSYIFMLYWSKKLVFFQVFAVLITFLFGKILRKTKKRYVLCIGILSILGILIGVKYSKFLGLTSVQLVTPIGISYYSLQAVSYMSDVYTGKIEKEGSLLDVAFYMSFFCTIMEGPITRFDQVNGELKSIQFENVRIGFLKILWGLYKKTVIADRLNPVVTSIFTNYTGNGALCLLGAVLCTLQLYMDFSGTIDIAIGAARMFGIVLPENFRQPFFAKNASDFWRRWHITLGTFLKDYVFYPISLSKPMRKLTRYARKHFGRTVAKFLAPSVAFLCVWLCNGFWHGPNWTYIAYGLYYFVFVLLELILEEPCKRWNKKLHLEGIPLKCIRFVKLFLIVIVGEMFFKASTFSQGWTMFLSILTRFHFAECLSVLPSFGISGVEALFMAASWIPIITVSVLKERGRNVIEEIYSLKLPLRWGILYALMLVIIAFGAYGPGFDSVAMMYANF